MTKSFLKIAWGTISKNKTQIITGLGIIGLYGTAYLTGKATLRANEICLGVIDDPSKLRLKEKLQLTWKEYIPAGLASLGTIFCMIQNQRWHRQKELALMALYTMVDNQFKTYQNETVREYGPNARQKLLDASKQAVISQNPTTNIIAGGSNTVRCYDEMSGRYFWSDINKLKRKENEINQRLRTDMQISLNELYFELGGDSVGLPPNHLGDQVGFNIDHGLLTFNYSSALTPEGEPCLVISYEVVPF